MPRPVVLVVDDSPEDAATIERLIRLAEPDSEIEVCHDADKALEWLWRRTPDLVLLDVAMPNHDGLALLDRVKNNPCTSEFPVLLVTGTVRDGDVEAYRGAGAAGLVRKDVDQAVFRDRLLHAVRPWLHP